MKTRTHLLRFLVIAFSFSLSHAQNSIWTRQNLDVGAVYSIAIDPSNSEVIHIGTYAFPCKSTNAGESWVSHPWETSVTNPYTDPISFAINPQNTSVIYVGGNGGHAYKSYDGGLNWHEISNGLPIDAGVIFSVIIEPDDTSVVYLAFAATELNGQGGIYKSTDGGTTWAATNNGLRITNAWSLAMDPGDPSVLYAGSWGVHKSSDAGENWTDVLPDVVAGAIVVDPAGVIYAGTFFGQGIHKSNNGGATWTPVNSGLPVTTSVWSLAIDPNDASTVYAGTENHGVFKSVNGGESWSQLSNGMEAADSKRVWALAVDPDNSANVYAGTIGGGLFKSTDAGSQWRKNWSYSIVTSFAVNPQNPSDILAGLGGTGVARSADGGQSWEHLFGDLYITDVFSVAMDPTDSTILYAGTSVGEGVVKSTDGGWVWTHMDSGLTISPWAQTWSVIVDPVNPSTIYAGADDNSGVFKSADGALSWTAINNGLTDRNIFTLALDPTDSNILYAGTINGAVFKSADGGNSWQPSSNGLPSAPVQSIAIDPTNPAVLFAGILGGGVYKSTNGGATWFPKNAGLTNEFVSSVVIDPANPSTVYAGTGVIDVGNTIPNNGNGVFKSIDGGESWAEFNDGLDNLRVIALAIAPGSPDALLAGTDGDGIFKFALVTSVSGNEDGVLPKRVRLFQNYPNPFNPQTTIQYQLPKTGKVTLQIYNLLGQEVRTLVSENQPVGSYSVVWDGKNDAGELATSGMYFYKLKVGESFLVTRKMLFLQ